MGNCGSWRCAAGLSGLTPLVLLPLISTGCLLWFAQVYFFGIIDVLERYSLKWKAQRAVLCLGYGLLLRVPDAAGMTALPPIE